MRITTRDEKETFNLGVSIGKILKPGMVISLNGDLGAGKTHFTKGIADGLGVDEYVTSPSFTILNQYEGRIPLYHFDVYRIEDINEMYEIGFEEYLYGEGVSVVEWGHMVEELLPKDTVWININKVDDNTREIVIENDEKLEGLKVMNI